MGAIDSMNLTEQERRYVLLALWNYRDTLSEVLSDGQGLPESLFVVDSAAGKFGGEPGRAVYGLRF
jgi:hypothetical protein